jgi:hypothetical protein
MNINRLEKQIDVLFDDAIEGMPILYADIGHFKKGDNIDHVTSMLTMDLKGILGNTQVSLAEDNEDASARQPDYRKIKNRALMSMVGCIETPSLMQNKYFPGRMIDDYYICHEKRFGGSRYELEEAAEYIIDKTPVDTSVNEKIKFLVQRKLLDGSKNVYSNRDLIIDAMIDGLIDFNRLNRGDSTDPLKIREQSWTPEERDMMHVTRSVPLDPETRIFLMGDVDGWESIQEYVDVLPDGNMPRQIENTILDVLLETERMIAENPDGFDDATIERIADSERSVLSKRRIEKFSMDFATNLALHSGFPGTRAIAACYPGLPDDIMDVLSKDSSPEVRASVANCTDKCDVLMKIKLSGGLSAKAKRLIDTRIEILGCK